MAQGGKLSNVVASNCNFKDLLLDDLLLTSVCPTWFQLHMKQSAASESCCGPFFKHSQLVVEIGHDPEPLTGRMGKNEVSTV